MKRVALTVVFALAGALALGAESVRGPGPDPEWVALQLVCGASEPAWCWMIDSCTDSTGATYVITERWWWGEMPCEAHIAPSEPGHSFVITKFDAQGCMVWQERCENWRFERFEASAIRTDDQDTGRHTA